MKNSAIHALIKSNFSRTEPGHTVLEDNDIAVEFLESYFYTHRYKVTIASTAKTNKGELDCFTHLEVFINDTSEEDGHYCIESDDVRKMLEIQLLRSDDKLHNKIFRSAPSKFTFWFTDGVSGEVEEEFVTVKIKQISQDFF